MYQAKFRNASRSIFQSIRGFCSPVAPPSNARLLFGKLFFGSLCATTFGLGVWQFQRYNWKVQLIDESNSKLTDSVVSFDFNSMNDISSLARECNANQGKKAHISGYYMHDREILLGPRSVPEGIFGEHAQGLAVNPQGYFVITPFKLDNG